ncbi:sensor histidine kinase [Nesterenkonia sp. F]|uniref:sensor histidine kinase n=1 Tax=Nesterenkonia sp. F TaxID=795955 RepID=UPI000255C965|nr:histidine kinase [Nesterenkonia sp. F]
MTARGRLRRHLWQLPLAALISLTSGVVVWVDVITVDPDISPMLLLLDLVLGIASMVLVGLRDRAPVTITLLICAATGFSVFALGPWLLAVVSLSTRRSLRLVALMLATSIASTVLVELIRPLHLGDMPFDGPWLVVALALTGVVVFAPPILTGWIVGARRALVESLRNEARAAEAERRVAGEQARTEERVRISREIHDEVGHRLSLIALHAGAMEYREGLTAEQVQHEAGVIRSSAHQAMGEVRRTLQVLRDDESRHRPEDPDPGLDLETRIRHLAQEADDAGSPTEVRAPAPLAELPSSSARHVHRIVQEALTNALRHAPGASVEITLDGRPDDRLELTVTNPRNRRTPKDAPVAVGGGLGLVGARERAELAGGQLVTEAGEDEFIVRAWVPWPS